MQSYKEKTERKNVLREKIALFGFLEIFYI